MEENIILNGIEYVPKSLIPVRPKMNGDIKIVILQRGWYMVGYFERDGYECRLRMASVIRKRGTSDGLGQIAANGPTSDTVLDKCNNDQCPVEFDYLTVIAVLPCKEEAWKNVL